ncbi:MAG: hypothetical protein HOI34_19230 [Rhodospirillaceae bacterium]|nr:hypothetical protein [Rhodospirillaceae bacterium]
MDFAPGWLDDPLLSDVMLAPDNTTSWLLMCGSREITAMAMPDPRVLVAPSPNGSVNVVLERPLDATTATGLQDALRDKGYEITDTDGVVGPGTRAAVAAHAETLGAAYRFETTAISQALLDSLGIEGAD